MSLPMNCPALIVNFYNHWLCDVLNKGYGVDKDNTPSELFDKLNHILNIGDYPVNSKLDSAKSIIDGNAVNRILALLDVKKNKDSQ
jgi:hypothetical protein